MLKKFLAIIFGSLIILSLPKTIFAKISTPEAMMYTTTASPYATPQASPVNSYSLFWPMSSGKTMQSKVYFLKTLKEKVRGFFIFGSAQKANYDLFLTIKRSLEAEALITGNVPDLANKTIDSAISDVKSANDSLTKAKNSSDIDKITKDEINVRTNNLKIFVKSLIQKYPNYNTKLQELLNNLDNITV